MHRLRQHEWQLAVCLTRVLLLMPVCWGVEQQYRDYYDLTPTPDYGDYNDTIKYFFFSNTSDEELDKYLLTREEPDEEVGVQEATATMTTSLGDEAFRTAPSLLLALGLPIIHIYLQLERIL